MLEQFPDFGLRGSGVWEYGLHGQRCGNEVCGKAVVCTSVFLFIPRRSPVGAAMTSHFFATHQFLILK